MELDTKRRLGLAVGAVIGAVLGVGTTYLLLTTPPEPSEEVEREPITSSELLSLTAAASVFIRRLDNLRQRLHS